MKAAELLVACLVEEGVRKVFGVPGEETLDLLEAIRTSPIDFVVTRHEQHAGFMAASWGRLSGRAGVCLATLGPGATNLVTPVAFANLGGMPLVALTGQKPIRDNWEGRFQVLDVVGTFRPLTKWATSIRDAGSIPASIRQAFKTAESERPGAVHLEIPEDITQAELVGEPQRRIGIRRPIADAKALAPVSRRVAESKSPIVIVGSGANRKRVGAQLQRFATQSGIYVVSTQMGKGVMPEDHEQSLFSLGIHKQDFVHEVLEQADLVICVGYSPVEYPPAVWNPNQDKEILHIDFVSSDPSEYYGPSMELVGDIAHSLGALTDRLEGEPRVDGARVRLRRSIGAALHDETADHRIPIDPLALVHQVRRALGRRDIVSLDNGIYKLWFARAYRAYEENTLVLDNALASMGAGLAGAMSAKMLFPERRCLAVCGDGGYLMNVQDLETAVRERLAIVMLIVRDDGYGFIRWKQADMGFPDYAMDFGNPDFQALARSFQALAMAAEDGTPLATTLEEAFRRAEQERLPVLVDCPVDYRRNQELANDLQLDAGDPDDG